MPTLRDWWRRLRSGLRAPARKAPGGRRPGRVVGVRGVIFQYDGRDALADWLIHPFEQIDRRIAGVTPLRSLRSLQAPRTALAVHVGLHLEVEAEGGTREVVAEQLFGTTLAQIIPNLLHRGLHWTPLAEFVQRDHGGWHVTVPPTAFRFIDAAAAQESIERLHCIEGRPFLVEDCVRFVERALGERRLFADSPFLKLLGLDVGVADPALPLLRRDVALEPHAAALLRAPALRTLPDARGQANRISAARCGAIATLLVLATAVGAAVRRPRSPRQS